MAAPPPHIQRFRFRFMVLTPNICGILPGRRSAGTAVFRASEIGMIVRVSRPTVRALATYREG
jgi:hypothetical protein